jgi:hypothetical protein
VVKRAFTHALIKGLNGEADGFQSAGAKDGRITMGELKEYMNITMPSETLESSRRCKTSCHHYKYC